MAAHSHHASKHVTIEKKIYGLSATCAVLMAFAFVVPRVVPNTEGGLASSASAAIVFLLALAVTAIVSLYLLWVTIRAYRALSPLARVAGIGPSVIAVGGLVALVVLLRY